MDNNEQQYTIDPAHLNEVLYKRLSVAQNEIINLEALATQLIAENKQLKEAMEIHQDSE